jgi:hypothetical protein
MIPNIHNELNRVREVISKAKTVLDFRDINGNLVTTHIGSTDVLPIAKMAYMLGLKLPESLKEDPGRHNQYRHEAVRELIAALENQIQMMFNLSPMQAAGPQGGVDFGQNQNRAAYFGEPLPQQPAPPPPMYGQPQYPQQPINPPVQFPQPGQPVQQEQPVYDANGYPVPQPQPQPPQQAYAPPVQHQAPPMDPIAAQMFGQPQVAAQPVNPQQPLTPAQQLGIQPMPGQEAQQPQAVPDNPLQALGIESTADLVQPHGQNAQVTGKQETQAAVAVLQPQAPRTPGELGTSAEGKAELPALPAGAPTDVDATDAFSNQSDGVIPTMVERTAEGVNASKYATVDEGTINQMMGVRGINFNQTESKEWKIRRLESYDKAASNQLSLA